MIRLEKKHLFVEHDGANLGDLDTGYVLGAEFTVRIEARDGHIKVFYNDAQKADYAFSGSGLYFKAGAYVQSNLSQGEPPDAFGEVMVSALEVTHS
jgi:poly(beta-D-mannuronate) lyase